MFDINDHIFNAEGKFDLDTAQVAKVLVDHLYLSILSPAQILEILTFASTQVSAHVPTEPSVTDLPAF